MCRRRSTGREILRRRGACWMLKGKKQEKKGGGAEELGRGLGAVGSLGLCGQSRI